MKTALILVLTLGGMNYPQMVTNTKIVVKKVQQHVKHAAKKVVKVATLGHR